MSQETSHSRLSVALLLSEIEDVKEITEIFKKLGVIPHFYEDLKTFWHGTLERMPSLAIVDVKKMNECGLVLKNHPYVMNEEMPLLFFYSERTEPLLISTQEIFHLGTIKKAKNYEGIFKALLKRINKLLSLEQENHNLKFDLNAKNESIQKLEKEQESIIKVGQYQNLPSEIASLIENESSNIDFYKMIDNIINKVGAFESYSFAELSFNGQKLVSPIIVSKKYRAMPSMWLGQICQNGIELFAQNMANQVSLEVLGSQVVSMLLKGNAKHPEKMLFIKAVDELCFQHFDWALLEVMLNGLYAESRLRENKEVENSKTFDSMFSAMSFLDQFVFENNDGIGKKDFRLVRINLDQITDILIKKGTERFYFKKFHDDFLAKLEIQSKVPFKVIENGVYDFIFLVEAPHFELFFTEVKEFVARFAYYKYFENSEAVLFADVIPQVEMVPVSAYGLLKHTKRKDQLNSMVGVKHSPISWNRVDNEI